MMVTAQNRWRSARCRARKETKATRDTAKEKYGKSFGKYDNNNEYSKNNEYGKKGKMRSQHQIRISRATASHVASGVHKASEC